jgi:hypothetical protein
VHRQKRVARPQFGRRLDRHDDAAALRLDADEVARHDPAPRKIGRVKLEARLAGVLEELRNGTGAAHPVPLITQATRVETKRITRVRLLRDRYVRRGGKARAAVGRREHAVDIEPLPARIGAGRKRPLLRAAGLEQVVGKTRDVEIAASGRQDVLANISSGEHTETASACAHASQAATSPPSAARSRRRSSNRPLASPSPGTAVRTREIRRSEFVTVPSFSPQVVAGSSTSAKAAVSVSVYASCNTTSSARESPARTAAWSAATARIRARNPDHPDVAGSERCEHFRPPSCRLRGDVVDAPKRATSARCFSFGEIAMPRHQRRHPADFATTHRVRLTRQRKRPGAGPADLARRKMEIDERRVFRRSDDDWLRPWQ